MSDAAAKTPTLSDQQSEAVMQLAIDVRPDEVPGPHRLANGVRVGEQEVSAEESAAILSLAADVRPSEDVHPDPES